MQNVAPHVKRVNTCGLISAGDISAGDISAGDIGVLTFNGMCRFRDH